MNIPATAAAQCWPSGNYSLPSSTDGCPSTETHSWVAGFHYSEVDVKSFRNNTRTTTARDLHLLGGVWDASVFLSFCTRSTLDSQLCDTSTKWPVGQYCIFSTGNECPDNHFQRGSTEWAILPNSTRFGGTSAISSTDDTATVNFCCSVNGSVTTEISLPNTDAFYLMPSSGNVCQRVKGMEATMEALVWQASEQPRNNLSTPVLLESSQPVGTYKFTLPLCYYTSKGVCVAWCCDICECVNAGMYGY